MKSFLVCSRVIGVGSLTPNRYDAFLSLANPFLSLNLRWRQSLENLFSNTSSLALLFFPTPSTSLRKYRIAINLKKRKEKKQIKTLKLTRSNDQDIVKIKA